MYKFTNGVIVYDEVTRDKYIKAGMTLIKEEVKEEKNDGRQNLQSEIKPREFERNRKKPERFGKKFK